MRRKNEPCRDLRKKNLRTEGTPKPEVNDTKQSSPFRQFPGRALQSHSQAMATTFSWTREGGVIWSHLGSFGQGKPRIYYLIISDTFSFPSKAMKEQTNKLISYLFVNFPLQVGKLWVKNQNETHELFSKNQSICLLFGKYKQLKSNSFLFQKERSSKNCGVLQVGKGESSPSGKKKRNGSPRSEQSFTRVIHCPQGHPIPTGSPNIHSAGPTDVK